MPLSNQSLQYRRLLCNFVFSNSNTSWVYLTLFLDLPLVLAERSNDSNL